MTKQGKKTGKREQTENSLANLVPFEKGVSGNPKGRPIGAKSKSTIIHEIFNAMKIKDQNGEPIDDPLAYFAIRTIQIIEGKGSDAVKQNSLKMLTDRFVGPVEKITRFGKTPDEIARLSRGLIIDLKNVEDVDYE